MDWSYKFGFDELQELLDNRPWLLVDDDFSSADNDAFLGMQKELFLRRGWDWFKTTLRGRVFPKLHLTTLTTWDRQRNPDQGDPDPNLVAKVQQKFPGISIVSLIGTPHVVAGPPVAPNILNRISQLAHTQYWKQGLKKIAAADDKETDFDVPYYKDEFKFEIADVDRYATDKYFANLALQETTNLYSIGFQMYNYQVGLTGAVQYWHYEKNELDRAKKTFNEIKIALQETMSDIEYNRPPMAVITPMVRAALQSIDIGRRERSGNYFHNWFEEVFKEPDWRTTIYGNRYPPSTIQYIDAFWNQDDASKEIAVEGTSSRSRVLKYKPSHGTISKYASDNTRLRQLLSDVWKIPFAGAAGGVLAWLLSLGIPPAQLEQQLLGGISPQQLITQVAPERLRSEQDISVPVPVVSPNSEDSAENKPNSANLPVEILDNSPETTKIPRGVRNNNPGNLERNKTVWQGMAEDQSDERFVTFASPEYGIRAMARVLKNYGRRHGLRTVEQIISRWAPASENQTDSYIQHVSQELQVSPTELLNLDDPDLLGRLIRAIIQHENGASPYDDETIARGIALEKSGGIKGIYRYAYQEIDWTKAKQMVRQLVGLPWHPIRGSQSVVEELIKAGVPRSLFGRLFQEVYVVERSYAYAESWSHMYAGCETG